MYVLTYLSAFYGIIIESFEEKVLQKVRKLLLGERLGIVINNWNPTNGEENEYERI